MEAILLTHPAVKEAVVVGMPHPVDGEHPLAAVVLKPGLTTGTKADEIAKYVNSQYSFMYCSNLII